MMFSDGVLDDAIKHVEQAQHAGFVRAHLTAEADEVGKHDRRQLARLSYGCLW